MVQGRNKKRQINNNSISSNKIFLEMQGIIVGWY